MPMNFVSNMYGNPLAKLMVAIPTKPLCDPKVGNHWPKAFSPQKSVFESLVDRQTFNHS